MDASQFARCIHALYETPLNPGHWGVAIEEIGRLFGASTASMFHYDLESRSPRDFRIWNLDVEVERRYASYYHRLDPAAVNAMFAPVGLWQADETLLYAATEAHREYISDFALRSNIGRVGGAKVAGDDRGCLFLSLQRPPGADRFGSASHQIYALLEPHIRLVDRIRERLDMATAGERLARSMLDRLRCGILVCASDGRVLLANAAGAAVLSRSKGLTVRHGRLLATMPGRQQALATALARACAPIGAVGSALWLGEDGSRRSGGMFIVPVPASHELVQDGVEPLALVAFARPPADPGPVELMRQLFMLSQTEASLLTALLTGASVQDVATQRGVKVSTVRSQLHSLLAKTGSTTQAGLANLARSMPPV